MPIACCIDHDYLLRERKGRREREREGTAKHRVILPAVPDRRIQWSLIPALPI
jgi:hypothetical protein